MNDESRNSFSRRDFLKTTAAAGLAAAIPGSLGLHAQGSDTLRVGVIGCGGRGTGAALDCLNAAPGVEIVALFDPFQDRIDSCLKTLKEKGGDKIKVTPDTCFTGMEGYKQLLALPAVNMIVTAAPPGFRPGTGSRPALRRSRSTSPPVRSGPRGRSPRRNGCRGRRRSSGTIPGHRTAGLSGRG